MYGVQEVMQHALENFFYFLWLQKQRGNQIIQFDFIHPLNSTLKDHPGKGYQKYHFEVV